tara:strand:- start:2047 stop:2472 length:426 start_codon:yes stop_codon:yes gene_type:complete
MNLIPRNAFHSLDSLFEDAFPTFRLMPQSKFEPGQLAVDVKENDDNYLIKADFPGMKKDDIEISIDNNVLTIQAEYDESKEEKEQGKYLRQERRYGKYSRSFNLGLNIDESKIVAEYDNGVLSLTVPKGDIAPASRSIPIK